MPIPLDLFAAFAAVAERGGFTAAARDLDSSKATVSKQVAELERRLGVMLFARTTRKLALTEAGETVLRRARRMIEEAEAAVEEAAEGRSALSGRLRIAAPLTFATRWLAPVLPDFLAAHPDVQLELDLDDRRTDLIADGFDAALRVSMLEDSSLTARQLTPVRLHVVASPAYWAARGRPARPEDLALHACFRYANLPTGSLWRFRAADGAEARVRVTGPLCVNNGDAELPALRAGLGVARLPDFIVQPDLDAGFLETALDAWSAEPLVLHLLTPPGRGASRRMRAFSDFLADRFGGGRAPWLNSGQRSAVAPFSELS